MKVLLVCMKDDYGLPKRGPSYEWNHFYLGLKPHFRDVGFYDYMGRLRELGKARMQQDLVERVRAESPDVAVFSLYTDQIEPETVDCVRRATRTLCFFHDDGWRTDFVRKWAPHFDAFTTSDPNGERKYRARGWTNAIFMPFGVNEALFSPLFPRRYEHDVSFVGGRSPYREWLVRRLRKAGYKVDAYGDRWPAGMLSTEEMVRVFRTSRVNLNMSNSASWDLRYLLSSPRAFRNTLRSTKTSEQIKGRHFEIPACGGFQLSYYVEGIEAQVRIGEEIAIYVSPEDMIEKVAFYLEHEAERERVADAGLQRVRAEHTYGARFREAFRRLGWNGRSP